MSMIMGIDIGGSTTKIVGLDETGKLLGTLQVRANDPVTSAYGAFGRFLRDRNADLGTVGHVVVTGVGSAGLRNRMYGLPVTRVEEFAAIGRGGLALSKLEKALVVSMGTGTAYVRASGEKYVHLGGSGVGGGTITGLCARLAGATNFSTIMNLAREGDISKVNLLVSDISPDQIDTLPPDLTASNFGRWCDEATPADGALATLRMTFETIGMLAVFACLNDTLKTAVLTGTLTLIPYARVVFDQLERMHGLNFVTPPNATFATAVGAALTVLGQYRLTEG